MRADPEGLLFDFDNTKLEFAKFAYDYVVDPENYYKINDAFDFNQSRSSLTKFVRSKS